MRPPRSCQDVPAELGAAPGILPLEAPVAPGMSQRPKAARGDAFPKLSLPAAPQNSMEFSSMGVSGPCFKSQTKKAISDLLEFSDPSLLFPVTPGKKQDPVDVG